MRSVKISWTKMKAANWWISRLKINNKTCGNTSISLSQSEKTSFSHLWNFQAVRSAVIGLNSQVGEDENHPVCVWISNLKDIL